MTPDEAITDLECLAESKTSDLDDDERTAVALGIEALKWYKGAKEDGCIRSDYFLPGETRE